MEFLIDNQETERIFQRILRAIPSMQNGITAQSMMERGVHYEKNWGVSTVDLKNFASKFEHDHLLALKLWNKKWRETMLLATMLDVPAEVTEEQMDFWIKSAVNIEVIDHAIMNLFTDNRFAFIKAMEWCRGKKYQVKYAGLMLMGRLAFVSKNSIDEMFEPFFDLLIPLAKDTSLHTPIFRSVCQLARRSNWLLENCRQYATLLIEDENEASKQIGSQLDNEFKSEFYIRHDEA